MNLVSMFHSHYDWKVTTKEGSKAQGRCRQTKVAQVELLNARKQFEKDGQTVNHYSITNQDNVLVLAVDRHI